MNVKYNLSKYKPNSATPQRKEPDTTQFRDYCQNSGHTRDKCFCLHGYPEWHKLHGKPKPKPRKLSAPKSAAHVTGASPATSSAPRSSSDIATDGMVFSDAQCQQLSKMIQESIKLNTNWPVPSAGTHMSGINSNISYSCFIVDAHSVLTDTPDQHTWILDSGATNHITCYQHLLYDVTPTQSTLYLPDGNTVPITHTGTVHLTSDIVLYEVLCAPQYKCNLISVAKLLSHPSSTVLFSATTCVFQDLTLKKEREIGRMHDGLYKLHVPSFESSKLSKNKSILSHLSETHSSATLSYCNAVHTSHALLWHSRMGHSYTAVLNKIPVVESHSISFHDCDVCHYSKQHRSVFPTSTTKTEEIFELVHLDVWGPYRQPTHNNYNYFLTMVDEFSKATWVLLFVHKNQVGNLIKNFLSYVSNHFHTSVKTLRSDNGTEFINHDLQEHLKNSWYITSNFMSCYTLTKWDCREKTSALLEHGQSFYIYQSHLPNSFWRDFILTAAYIVNFLPVQSLGFKTPFELLYKKPPTYTHIRTFGCLC